MRWVRATVAGVLLSVAASGCGTKVDRVGVAQQPSGEVRADGRLTADPKPLTLKDVDAQPSGSPQRAVLTLWFWAQWGSAPNIIAAYDPKVVERTGQLNVLGAYAAIRQSVLQTRPRIVSVQQGNGVTTVLLEVLSRTSTPARHSFALERVDGKWLIENDTLLEGALPGYVQSITQRTPVGAKPDAAAVRAGLNAAATYRGAFADQPDNARRNAGK